MRCDLLDGNLYPLPQSDEDEQDDDENDGEDDTEGGDDDNKPEYNRLKDADIGYIDESADELEDGLSDLKSGNKWYLREIFDITSKNISEDMTVDSSASSSLIQMSVVDTGPGVRRSSVVVIEHVPGSSDQPPPDPDQEIQTHIFV